MSRLQAMTQALRSQFADFIKLVPPDQRSEGLYRRIRHIQKMGECCGVEMSAEQLHQIIALAARKTVKDPVLYLCRVLDRVHVEKTLETVREYARRQSTLDLRVRSMAKYVRIEAAWQLKVLSDRIHGKYSMNDLMTACEIAAKKKQPARYLLAMFRDGYKKPSML